MVIDRKTLPECHIFDSEGRVVLNSIILYSSFIKIIDEI